jgi:hypothetical protein
MNSSRLRSIPVLLVFGAIPFCAGCGVKSAPLAPELVLPARIADLRAPADSHGIKLSWGRPTHYTGGHTMRDLGGFVILRGAGAGGRMEPLVELPVTDRERFAVEHEFSYIDNETVIGQPYRYEIVSRTLDGYTSAPSNEVDFTSITPASPPNPDTFKVPSSTSATQGG